MIELASGLSRTVVRVLPERGGEEKLFDYTLPDGETATVGDRVKVPLGSRTVQGWIVAVEVEPPAGLHLKEIAGFRGMGPSDELVALSTWASWRWAGSRRSFLRTASPSRLLPTIRSSRRLGHQGVESDNLDPTGAQPSKRALVQQPPSNSELGGQEQPDFEQSLFEQAWTARHCMVQMGPSSDPWPWVMQAVASTSSDLGKLVLAPSQNLLDYLQRKAIAHGVSVARLPQDWARAAGVDCTKGLQLPKGAEIVLGSRAAAWGPVANLGVVIVLDVHDEAWVETRSPTWNAVEVSLERARRCGARWLGFSCCPPLAMRSAISHLKVARSHERQAWAKVEVLDLNELDPKVGLLSERAVDLMRTASPKMPALCVLNRKGRAKLLACSSCTALARCESCGTALGQPSHDPELVCPVCKLRRPIVCSHCSSTKLRLLRPGVSRLAEEIGALIGGPVEEITASSEPGLFPTSSVIIGTEAVLHRVNIASSVIFLDFDQELLAPHYRASEVALFLLARASRILRGRRLSGRILIQSRLTDHEVIAAAIHANPSTLIDAELERRKPLNLPPYSALAVVTGTEARMWLDPLTGSNIEVSAVGEAKWIVRASDHEELSAGFAKLGRVPPRTRIEVDPLRA